MVNIGIACIIIANVFVYIRKIILVRNGHKVAWLHCWGDWILFRDVIDRSHNRRKMFLIINWCPTFWFIIGALLFFVGLHFESKA